jgi:hypothetical protein
MLTIWTEVSIQQGRRGNAVSKDTDWLGRCVRWVKRDAGHSPPSVPRLQLGGSLFTHTHLLYPFMACCSSTKITSPFTLPIWLGERGKLNRYSDWLRAGRPPARFPAGVRDFSLLHSVQTGSGAHPASHPVGTGGSFPSDKRWSCTFTPPPSWHGA